MVGHTTTTSKATSANVKTTEYMEVTNMLVEPTDLVVGDLLFLEWFDPQTDHLMHVAMYIGNSTYIDSLPVLGVAEHNWSFYSAYPRRKWGRLIPASANAAMIDNAIGWAQTKKGDDYQYEDTEYNYYCNPSGSIWVCSELIWAAFFKAGLPKDWAGYCLWYTDGPPTPSDGWWDPGSDADGCIDHVDVDNMWICTPNNILDSNYVTEFQPHYETVVAHPVGDTEQVSIPGGTVGSGIGQVPVSL